MISQVGLTTGIPSILHASVSYPPYQIGGTEIYLEGLVADLKAHGISSSVLMQAAKDVPVRYVRNGTEIATYPVNDIPFPTEMRQGKPHAGFDEFVSLLLSHRGSIYHQHSWSRGCGPHHLRAARELGMRTVLTVHVPGNICLRGTMLEFGTSVCDGVVEPARCGACWGEGRGLPKPVARTLARVPLRLAEQVRRIDAQWATGLALRAVGDVQKKRLGAMIENSDRIVAVCQWLYDSLQANGVPAHKLVLSRQGVSTRMAAGSKAPIPGERSATSTPQKVPLRLIYLGRWHPVKGIDVVVRAIRALPAAAAVQLAIHGIASGEDERRYEALVRHLAGGDPRIRFEPAVPHTEIIGVLGRHDVLVVPSLWLETGPLVVLEAQIAGLFVLGSRLGVIAELVHVPEGGEIVAAGDDGAWTAALHRLFQRHAEAPLRLAARQVRTMRTVAAEMADLYGSL